MSALALAFLVSISGTSQHKTNDYHIIVVSPLRPKERWVKAEQRIVGELETLGVRITKLKGRARREAQRKIELMEFVSVHKAAAALRLTRLPQKISLELWVTDQVASKLNKRTILTSELPKEISHDTYVGIAAVEMLEAALIEIGIAPNGFIRPQLDMVEATGMELSAIPEENTGPSMDLTAIADTETETAVESGWALNLEGLFALNPEEVHPMGGVGLGISRTLGSYLELGVAGTSEFVSKSQADTAGNGVSHLSNTVGLRLVGHPHRSKTWLPEFGLGGGLYILRARGKAASSTVQNRTTLSVGGSAELSAGLRIRLHRRFALRLSVGGQYVIPKIETRLPSGDTVPFGPFLLRGTLGAAICLNNGPC